MVKTTQKKALKPAIEMVEVDRTEHNMDMHTHAIQPKSSAWYGFWNNHCPVCKEPAHVVLEKDGEQSQQKV